ncbi:MAG: hypothetical protein COW71_00300, partial [Ignavibacteriales bacterium CG18_big_fil_WC_8_21_14_2_50_31_20]
MSIKNEKFNFEKEVKEIAQETFGLLPSGEKTVNKYLSMFNSQVANLFSVDVGAELYLYVKLLIKGNLVREIKYHLQ